MSNDRGRSRRRRLSDTGCEYSAGMMTGYAMRKERREGGSSRRSGLKRQPSLGLTAVHEEDTWTDATAAVVTSRGAASPHSTV